MTARCECCKGKREVIGLGNILKKCLSCMGIGWKKEVVIDKRVEVEEVIEDKPEVLVTGDKRVREFRDNKKNKRG